ncbi:MAG: bifunctional demethylmenaquinone methyltransferase/2-methoxy-6-polyprenyl-1,4-benzoquinol methylase UbiE [Burkholderiales bacterium]|nr:bifunctional demethylmenaquinone methyltransferase/2-methoxy-6-polyprenyl-1,4-benzoquinol methylase UbiE [Burkholderiales bacterium]
MTDTTHFGFQTIAEREKTAKVAGVFDSIAPRYDLMNDLMSAGMHRLWKRFAVDIAGVKSGERVLDLAGGSADLSSRFARKIGPRGELWLTDINNAMLTRGRARLLDEGVVIPVAQCDAEHLPFPANRFDCISIAFGLRNLTHKEQGLREMLRVLRPGGRLVILEFSKIWQPLQALYDAYSFQVLPRLGKLVAKDADSYRYLAESIRMHPAQEDLKQLMESAGFERVEYFNLSAGVVAVHKGYKL